MISDLSDLCILWYEHMFYLYRITNMTNNKVYIGQSVDPTGRWRAHRRDSANPKVPIQHAIKKYGQHNFEFEVIAQCLTQNDANQLETELVSQYDSFIANGKGYNATHGGSNAPKSQEWRNQISQIREDPDWKKKYAETYSKSAKRRCIEKPHTVPVRPAKPSLGVKQSPELKAKHSEIAKSIRHLINKPGRRKLTPEQTQAVLQDTRSFKKIAIDYGVSDTLIGRIKKRGN